MLSPESPYPLHGGGAFRVASLAHYFSRFAAVDLVLFSETGKPAPMPAGLFRSQDIITLPPSKRNTASRYIRNAKRAARGVPPLIDRLSGHAAQLNRILAGRRYDLGIVEHFWAAPYLTEMQRVCGRTILDLHNIESVLHTRCAETDTGLVSLGQRRFAKCAETLERRLLPGYWLNLVTSEPDAATARTLAPRAQIAVYPNALPEIAAPRVTEEPVVVFSGNFEYHPNIDAVDFLVRHIWPEVKRRCPGLKLRLVGKGDEFIRHRIPSGTDIEVSGAIADSLTEIAKARIAVAPLRAGSGTRIKIIEAWAASRPVVATKLAAEGLKYTANSELMIANEAAAIAQAIADLNLDPVRRERLGEEGRRMFTKNYTWSAAWRSLDAALPAAGLDVMHRYTEDSDANRR